MDRKQTGGQRDVEKGQNASLLQCGQQQRPKAQVCRRSVKKCKSNVLYSSVLHIIIYISLCHLSIVDIVQFTKEQKEKVQLSWFRVSAQSPTVYCVQSVLLHLQNSPFPSLTITPRACDYHCIYHEDPLSICG